MTKIVLFDVMISHKGLYFIQKRFFTIEGGGEFFCTHPLECNRWVIGVFCNLQGLGCFASGMGQFPVCKLKWDLLRTSVTACSIDKNTFIAPFGIFHVRMEIFKKSHVQTPNGVLLIFKHPFPNGSNSNGVCRALWALCNSVAYSVA